MPSLKDLKNRIESVKSTRKITSAMKMVAAAKLRRAQEAAEQSRPYAEAFARVTARLAASARQLDSAPRLLRGTGSDQVHLLVVMTAERGLCGGFNTNIVRLAREHIESLLAHGKTVKILTVGRKGRDQLRREYAKHFVGHVDLSGVRKVGYANAQEIARDVLGRFDEGEFDVATIFYAKFVNVISQEPTAQQIVPVPLEAEGGEGEESAEAAYFEFEPAEEVEFLRHMLPRAVATSIFSALLENGASEMGSRMTAMENATRNAGEMIDKLTIVYNRTRQATITKELIEIISGAEAL
jgi:F-type H+-transporting ATPase subunit gamma